MTSSARRISRSAAMLVSVTVCLSTAQAAPAAPTNSGIEIQVVDQSGATVAGPRVTLADETGREVGVVSTGPYDVFRTANLAPGSYSLRVACPGFHIVNKTIRVEPGLVSKLRIELELARGQGTLVTGYPITSQALPDFELRRRPRPILNEVLPPQ